MPDESILTSTTNTPIDTDDVVDSPDTESTTDSSTINDNPVNGPDDWPQTEAVNNVSLSIGTFTGIVIPEEKMALIDETSNIDFNSMVGVEPLGYYKSLVSNFAKLATVLPSFIQELLRGVISEDYTKDNPLLLQLGTYEISYHEAEWGTDGYLSVIADVVTINNLLKDRFTDDVNLINFITTAYAHLKGSEDLIAINVIKIKTALDTISSVYSSKLNHLVDEVIKNKIE